MNCAHGRRLWFRLAAAWALTLALPATGCDAETTGSTNITATWHGDVRAGLQKWCGGCHSKGGIGPFALDDAATASKMVNASIHALQAGTMPPYRANDACRTYKGHWMGDADVAALTDALTRWKESGTPVGDEADYKAPELPDDPLKTAGKPTLSLKIDAGYEPDAKLADDYRCFVLPHVFAEETFLRMSNVVPDQDDLVHHVLAYVVQENYVPTLKALDDAEKGPGYTCFGGAGVGSPNPVAGWAPGKPPAMSPADAMTRIPKGAMLVMQVHYNLAAGKTASDKTRLDLWTTTDKPKYVLTSRPMPHFGIKIPAGATDSSHTRLFENTGSKPWEIIGTTPHMHTFGKAISVHRVAEDGAKECLVDIGRWDFNWQLGYPFKTDEPVIVQPGEKLELTCVYDNTAKNQPKIGGKQVEPKEVTWGEGTLDEMCLNYILVKEPYKPVNTDKAVCKGFDACYSDCRKDKEFGDCILSCGLKIGGKCQTCVYTATIQCGLTGACTTDTAPLYECISDCKSRGACIYSKCTKQLDRFQQCVGPEVDKGKCAPQLSACGVKL